MLHLMRYICRIKTKHIKIMKILKSFLIASLLGLITISCKDDDSDAAKVEIPLEEEVITTVIYTLTDTENNEAIFKYEDKDGEGGNAPIISPEVTLKANTLYTGKLQFLNESGAEVEDITVEIKEKDEEHQVFFITEANNISVAYKDEDENKNPLGLENELTTTTAGKGTLGVTLIHEPMKNAEGVKNGDITNAGGEPDIEVSFKFNVQ